MVSVILKYLQKVEELCFENDYGVNYFSGYDTLSEEKHHPEGRLYFGSHSEGKQSIMVGKTHAVRK